ncbi:hypothetical protein BO70DRAFT_422322 [Aspergillus heteromorphus CBS 117.55]|uniref:Uncharacterized protein n=1 Tax=Aspergillus heteromorphus CBS 117.55 TaxID=1448321 RepID=A0A317WJU0_9EURO|nr:uncharacterized protein BO70DRAFT_422322 [Aspergillus heteromorphus CBS 117.55]PWY86714.1 hypothetical protein BO70DRAFT_422322 [Aspergillus heteromorphus CBS 117.55]
MADTSIDNQFPIPSLVLGKQGITETATPLVDNASFDIKCDALRLLLACLEQSLERSQSIVHLLQSVCRAWWEGKMEYSDNRDESFARQSFAWAFADLTWQIYQGRLEKPTEPHLFSEHAPIVLIQMATRILIPDPKARSPVPVEETARDYLTLRTFASVPFMDVLEADIQAEAHARQQILEDALRDTSLSSSSRALVLVALQTQPPSRVPLDAAAEEANQKQALKLSKFAQYFYSTEYMKGEPLVAIKASILESSFYTALLKAKRADIFPMTDAKEHDKYLEYIPPMSTLQSNYHERGFPPQWLHDLHLWSMFIFLVDENMEAAVVHFTPDELHDFAAGLELIHPDPDPRYSIIATPQLPSLASPSATTPPPNRTPRVQTALDLYYSWARWVTNWPRLAHATATDMNEFRSEVKKYLLAHVHQIWDNIRLAAQQNRSPTIPDPSAPLTRFDSPRTAYATWVHTIGASHISGTISLPWVACYMGSGIRGGRDGWSSVMQRMLAHEMNQHVGAYCRLYNDYGSVTRDAIEGNLNSVNFPEFWTGVSPQDIQANDGEVRATIKADLLAVAKHERRMADYLGDKLYKSLEDEGGKEGRWIAGALRVYFRSAELFSDMYLTRDVTNTVK